MKVNLPLGPRSRWSALALLVVLALLLLVREPSSEPCSEPTDASCIRAVYAGAPNDYEPDDIPASELLRPDAEGRYEVRGGQQITVVTAAGLPDRHTGFVLTRRPEADSAPVGLTQAITRSGTAYTFTVNEEETGPALVTFDLAAARPGAGGEQERGEVVVTTVFQVVSCSSGIAVPDPESRPGLVGDCESLLAMRDTLAGTATLDWYAGRPLAEWTGVTVAGRPPRVTKLELADRGLVGELSGLVGTLTALTELRLEGNALTGMIPYRLATLSRLTHAYLAGNSFAVCVPRPLGRVANNDFPSLGLMECGAPRNVSSGRFGEVLPPGTYWFGASSHGTLFFDIPTGVRIQLRSLVIAGPDPETGESTPGLILEDEATGSSICLDIERAVECGRGLRPAQSPLGGERSVGATFDRIAESLWRN